MFTKQEILNRIKLLVNKVKIINNKVWQTNYNKGWVEGYTQAMHDMLDMIEEK